MSNGGTKSDEKVISFPINLNLTPISPLLAEPLATDSDPVKLIPVGHLPTYIQMGQDLFQPDMHGNGLMMLTFDSHAANAIFAENEWQELLSLLNYPDLFDAGRLKAYRWQHKKQDEQIAVNRAPKTNRIIDIVRTAYTRAKTAREQLGLPPGRSRRCGDILTDRVGDDERMLHMHKTIAEIMGVDITLSNHDAFFIAAIETARLYAAAAKKSGKKEDREAYKNFLNQNLSPDSQTQSIWSFFQALLNVDLIGVESVFNELVMPYYQSIDLINYSGGILTSHASLLKHRSETKQDAILFYLRQLCDHFQDYITSQLNTNQQQLLSQAPEVAVLQKALHATSLSMTTNPNTDENLELWALLLNKAFKIILTNGLFLGDPSKLYIKPVARWKGLTKNLLNLTQLPAKSQHVINEIKEEFISNSELGTRAQHALVEVAESISATEKQLREAGQSVTQELKDQCNGILESIQNHLRYFKKTYELVPKNEVGTDVNNLQSKINKLLDPRECIADFQLIYSKFSGFMKFIHESCSEEPWSSLVSDMTYNTNHPGILRASRHQTLRAIMWSRATPSDPQGEYTTIGFFGHQGDNTGIPTCIDTAGGKEFSEEGFTKVLAVVPPKSPKLVAQVDDFFKKLAEGHDSEVFCDIFPEQEATKNTMLAERNQLANAIIAQNSAGFATLETPGLFQQDPAAKVLGVLKSTVKDAIKAENFRRIFILWLDYHARNTPAEKTDFWSAIFKLDDSSVAAENIHQVISAKIDLLRKITERDNAAYQANLHSSPKDEGINKVAKSFAASTSGKGKIFIHTPTSALQPGGVAYITPHFDPEKNLVEALALLLPLDRLRAHNDPVSNALLTSDIHVVGDIFLDVFGDKLVSAVAGNKKISPPGLPDKRIDDYSRRMATWMTNYYHHLKRTQQLPLRTTEIPFELDRISRTASCTAQWQNTDALYRPYKSLSGGVTLVCSALPDRRKSCCISYLPASMHSMSPSKRDVEALLTAQYLATLNTAWQDHLRNSENPTQVILLKPNYSLDADKCMQRAWHAFNTQTYRHAETELKQSFLVEPRILAEPEPIQSASETHGGSTLVSGGGAGATKGESTESTDSQSEPKQPR